MSEYINTEQKTSQYNGPVNSTDYNKTVEQNYKDLVMLYNRSGILSEELRNAFERVLKDHAFITQALLDVEDRLKSLESNLSGDKILSIYNYSQIDNAALLNTEYSVSGSESLYLDFINNIITLPKVTGSSYSKIKFFHDYIGQVVPDFFETKIDNTLVSVDSPSALIDTTPVYHAILDSSSKVWKRSVVVDSPSLLGAQLYLYIKIPTSYSGSDKTNFISLNPYPVFGTDILRIDYTTVENPSMSNSDGWTPLNHNILYDGISDAVGSVPPGAWTQAGTDALLNSGPIGFYFDPLPITAIRVLMRQRSYITENNKYVYTYGLSDIDIRSDKFLSTGKSIIRFDAPEGELIYNVTGVTAKIYNVPQELISTAFDYRVIYYDSGVYTEENPGSSSSVWVEVTLNQLSDGTAPVLSDLIVTYE
jgi:hypothetical protein